MPAADRSSDDSSLSSLSTLRDRAAISDVVYAYATGLDRRDWNLFRSIFMDTIEMDFRSVGLPSRSYQADRWVGDAKRLFAGFKATQHTSTNHTFDLRGDEATCTSNMQAEHFIERKPEDGLDDGADRWTIGGYYVNELVRTKDGWKLSEVTLNVTWQTGNADVSGIALKRGRAIEAAQDGP
jgi:hypothetical protein